MTPPELDEARALLAALRDGWLFDENDTILRPNGDIDILCHDVDYAFIARAPALLTWCVARIDALERQVRLLSTPFADAPTDQRITEMILGALTMPPDDGDEDAGDDEAR